jgi:SAM-dependent methyltransferase
VRTWILEYWPLITRIVLGAFLFACAWIYLSLPWGALWLPTPWRVVVEMLRRAGVQPGERVVDLGAGDGRIVIAAALLFKAEAVGVEIDPLRCLIANTLILLLGLRKKAHICYGNMYEFDLTGADLVTLYLWPSTNQRLRSRLIEQLRPGARVASYKFAFYGWTPVNATQGRRRDILIYEMGVSEPSIWTA